MSRQEYTAEHGPGWVDVEKAIDHVEHEFAGKVTCIVERHRRKGQEKVTLVKSEFRLLDEWPHGIIRVARQTWWDRREFKTVTAVLYNQVLGIDAWLTRAKEEAEKQAPLF